MRLPTAVVIGAMKCGTTALHRYLDLHPQIDMAAEKEVNFFNGPETPPETPPKDWWRSGQWHRGPDWYAGLFDPDAPVRGETSPAYTSPDHPEVPERMAALIPNARLVCLVRDPVERALSQYHHHRREGDETRSPAEALLDPDSQYLTRGRYFGLLQPFLQHFAPEQLLVVVTERLRVDRRTQLRRVFAHLGAAAEWWDPGLEAEWHVGSPVEPLGPEWGPEWGAEVRSRVADDTARLRELLADDLPEWSR